MQNTKNKTPNAIDKSAAPVTAIPTTCAFVRTGFGVEEAVEVAAAMLNAEVEVVILTVMKEVVIEGGIEPVNKIGELGTIEGAPLAVRRPVRDEDMLVSMRADEERPNIEVERLAVVDKDMMLPPEVVTTEYPEVTAVGLASVAVSVP